MSKFIPFSLPYIDENEIKEVIKTMKSGWLTVGPRVIEFEKKFKKYIGCKYSCAVDSCTSALHLSLVALNIGAGDEVITTPFTFCATANAIIHTGAKPVFADIREDTFNINPEEIKRKITRKTKAIIPVHYGGHPADLEEILKIAKENNLFVIEDAAHSLGSEYKRKRIGNFGDATCFSFYPTKNITCAEGGAITTNNKNLAEKVKLLSNHGISKGAWKRYKKEGSWYYEVIYPGFKYNMTDIQASIGIHQLDKLEKFLKIRKEYANIYNNNFSNVEEIIIPYVEKEVEHSFHLYVIQIKEDKLKIKRGEFIEKLRCEGIGCSVHFIPLHFFPSYQKKYNYKKGDFPVSEKVYSRCISLPLYPKILKKDIKFVIEKIKKIINENRR